MDSSSEQGKLHSLSHSVPTITKLLYISYKFSPVFQRRMKRRSEVKWLVQGNILVINQHSSLNSCFWSLSPSLFLHDMQCLMVSVKDTDHILALLRKCLCSEPAAAAQHGFIERRKKPVDKQGSEWGCHRLHRLLNILESLPWTRPVSLEAEPETEPHTHLIYWEQDL